MQIWSGPTDVFECKHQTNEKPPIFHSPNKANWFVKWKNTRTHCAHSTHVDQRARVCINRPIFHLCAHNHNVAVCCDRCRHPFEKLVKSLVIRNGRPNLPKTTLNMRCIFVVVVVVSFWFYFILWMKANGYNDAHFIWAQKPQVLLKWKLMNQNCLAQRKLLFAVEINIVRIEHE